MTLNILFARGIRDIGLRCVPWLHQLAQLLVDCAAAEPQPEKPAEWKQLATPDMTEK